MLRTKYQSFRLIVSDTLSYLRNKMQEVKRFESLPLAFFFTAFKWIYYFYFFDF